MGGDILPRDRLTPSTGLLARKTTSNPVPGDLYRLQSRFDRFKGKRTSRSASIWFNLDYSKMIPITDVREGASRESRDTPDVGHNIMSGTE